MSRGNGRELRPISLPNICDYGEAADKKAQDRRGVSEFCDGGPESQSKVISVTALKVKRADPSQGESSVGKSRPAGAKSLRLKILPLSC